MTGVSFVSVLAHLFSARPPLCLYEAMATMNGWPAVVRRRRRCASSARRGQLLEAPGVRAQRRGNCDRAVGVLIILQHGDQRAADGESGAVERVDELGFGATRRLVTDVRAATAEVGVRRTGRDLAILVLAGQ